MKRLVFSAKSRRDLSEIAEYIAKDSPRLADRQVTRIEQFCAGLVDKPNRFAVVAELRGTVRRALVRPYLIFYVVSSDSVFVARILHSARDYEKLLFPDED